MWPMRAECLVPGTDLRESAALLTILAYKGMAATSAAINVAALALSMERLVVYRPHRSAIDQVDATDLNSHPAAPPRLFHSPFVIESPDPRNISLFADVVSVAGYSLDGRWFVIFWRYPDGCGVFEWGAHWQAERDADFDVVSENSLLVPNKEEWDGLARQSIRFAIILGLLLDADGTPVEQRTEKPQRPEARRYGQKRAPATGWETRHLVVPAGRRPASEVRPEPQLETTREGLLLKPVEVRGFLRRQTHGPRNSERKWIYVEGFQSRRWVSPLPVRIDVRGAP